MLGDVTVDGRNEYGSILVVSMDGRPLAQSAKILLQVVSEDRNYGYKTKPVTVEAKGGGTVEAREITDVGEAPIVVRKLVGTVTLRRPDAAQLRVNALDDNGYKRQDMPAGEGDALTVVLLPDCFYYVIAR